MVDVNALLQGLDEQGALTPLRVTPDGIRTQDAASLAKLEQVRLLLAGTLEVDTSLAPVLAAGLDVRLSSAQVDALKPLATQPVSGSVTATVSNFPATQVVSGTVSTGLSQPLTDAQLRAASVAVSGPLTDAQLRATPVPISGTVTATPTGTQAVSGAVDVTDRAGRALGTVSTGLAQPLTDAQLRAASVPVTGLVTTAAAPDVAVAGTLAPTVGSTIVLAVGTAGGNSAFSFDIATFASGTFVIERTLHPTPGDAQALWTPIGAFKAGTRTSRSTWSEPGAFHGNLSASTAVRLRVTAALSGGVLVNMLASRGTGTITVGAIASNEGNVIGGVQTLAQVAATALGGRVGFNSSSGAVTTSGATEQLIAVFRNPTGSGFDLHIDKVALGSLLAGRFRRYRGGTFTPSNSQTASPNVNRGGGTNASVAVLNPRQTNGAVIQTTTTATGGVLGRIDYLPANDERIDPVDGSLILRPGDMQYWTFTPAAASAGECSVDVVWRDVVAAA